MFSGLFTAFDALAVALSSSVLLCEDKREGSKKRICFFFPLLHTPLADNIWLSVPGFPVQLKSQAAIPNFVCFVIIYNTEMDTLLNAGEKISFL